MDLKAQFWQLALAAELPASKVQRLEREVGSSGYPQDPIAFYQTVYWLDAAERERIATVKLASAQTALSDGAFLLERKDFPARLSEAPGTPPVLFGWGNVSAIQLPMIGIVGTRGASVYGRAAAQKFAEALSHAGVTIVSGGAMGIDAAAHEAVLKFGGKTVAVLPAGLDRAYPAVHRTLFKRIRESGLLLSQFALGNLPKKGSFQTRNALLAALCDCILIVEAPENSGALATAGSAIDIGRQVFVVPANISATSFRGSHELIRNGATLADHPDQILLDLGIRPSGARAQNGQVISEKRRLILGALTVDPVPTERIAASTGLATSEVLTELTMLELDGMVIRASAGYALKP